MTWQHLDLFGQHSRSWQRNRYVYPVISRRSRGLSIGVNLNPDRLCNFDCVYCCVDRTGAPAVGEVDVDALAVELEEMLGLAAGGEIFRAAPFDRTPPELRRLNDVAFSGDGEPTSFPRFDEACRIAAGLVGKAGLADVKIVVITNATLLHRPKVAEALAFLDAHGGEIWAKLDAGTDRYYRMVDRTSIPLSRVLGNIARAGRVRPVVIQSMFMKMRGEGPAASEIGAYVRRLRELTERGCQIKRVQVYTTARRTAEPYVEPLGREALESIAKRVREIALEVEAYYGPE